MTEPAADQRARGVAGMEERIMTAGQAQETEPKSFLDLVADERDYQRMRWGDVHDDAHTCAEWALILLRYAGRVGDALDLPEMDKRKLNAGRAAAVELAAACGAMVDAIDRAEERTTR